MDFYCSPATANNKFLLKALYVALLHNSSEMQRPFWEVIALLKSHLSGTFLIITLTIV